MKLPPLQAVVGGRLSMLHLKAAAPLELNANEGVLSLVGPAGPLVMSGTGGGVVSTVNGRVPAVLVLPSSSAAVT